MTQYQALLSTIKEDLMKKWNLIQNQSLLCQTLKQPPIISYNKGNHIKGHASESQNISLVNTRFQAGIDHLLQFFTKNNLRNQKLELCLQLTSRITFYCAL